MPEFLGEMLSDIARERIAQDERWGEQNHPDGTGHYLHKVAAVFARRVCDMNARSGEVTWADILREEFAEALAESDPDRLSEELNQVAAVAIAWREAISRRNNKGKN